MQKLIIFVCNGNIHRSVIAAESLRDILDQQDVGYDFIVDSYGLQGTMGTNLPKHKNLSEYSGEWVAAKPSLERLGIDISEHRSQKISASIMAKASAVIAMDEEVYIDANNSLIHQFPDEIKKIHRFSELTLHDIVVNDPSGSESEQIHREVIENIYFSLSRKYKVVLGWAK